MDRNWINRRNILIAASIAVVAVLAFVLVRTRHAPVQADVTPAVSLATVRYGVYEDKVNVSGRVGAPAGAQTKPAFAIAGVLASIDVHVGQTVRAGEPLAQLDTGGLAMSARQAQADAAAAAAGYGGGAVPSAQLRTAQAKLALASQRLQTIQSGGAVAQSDRVSAASMLRQAQIKVQSDTQTVAREEQLFAAGVAARKDLDAARAQLAADMADESAQRSKVTAASTNVGGAVAQARADYAQALSDVRTAQAQSAILGAQAVSAQARASAAARDYRNGTLVAPVDGVITGIYKHSGESVDSTTAVVAIGPASQHVVTLDVPANDARRIAIGDLVVVRVTGSNAAASGRVTGVAPAVDPATQSATVVVNVTPPGAIAGDAIDASIVVARDRGFIIPQAAIVQDPQTGDTVVFLQTKAKDGSTAFVQRSINVLKSDGTTAQITGLPVGAHIAAQGAFQLLAPAGGG